MNQPAPLPLTHKAQVAVRQTRLLIDGEFRNSLSGKTFATVDPSTEEVIAQVAEGDAEDIDLAVQAARKAFDSGPWRQMDARERGRRMLKWADLIEDHMEELAKLEVLDNGKPINEALGYDIPSAAATLRYFAGWADKIHGKTIPISGPFFTYTRREPVGVCGLIIPWNFPLAMAAWKLGPALAAGCTAILKPAEQTPLTALRAGELALEAGIPPGVLNIVPGFGPTAGAALVQHPLVEKIAFTGEYKTAQTIKQATINSMKRLSFELGGKSPNIIFNDANLEEAITGSFGAIFLNQGQNCCAGSRAFVHNNIYDEFVEQFAEKAAKRKLGDPFDPATEHGAQIDKAQFDKIMRYIALGKEQGAKCVTGGERAFEQGYFIQPTIFREVKEDMAIATDEIFGPVASVLRFKDINEVIEKANNTPFGLAAAVWTQDIDKANAVAAGVKAGTVWVNCYNVVDPAAPFGGFKLSGLGRELGEQALDAYTETKTVTVLRR
ncbi:aldehyde dehydrogenase family protein [Nitrosococcus watsonii]|uniref:Retinal dehydrogenase n=1 Tax=Nitrosococcus watsoni (strain C-113) TaxID=105559 RepID=D8KAG3_NITWC|nr:aldehyde dehydrogenase family protein [Nitrosococcus watsonii]ADJ27478.1 Retinal dehydrogenase [Nitrosococcus watsonii C-113]